MAFYVWNVRNIVYFTATMLILLFVSCGNNVFTFNEEKQVFEAADTYFGCIMIQGIGYYEECFIIRRKPYGKKVKSISLTEIPESYYIIHCRDNDTIKDFKLKINSEYEVINRGVYDASPSIIILTTDEKGLLHYKSQ